MEKRILLVEDDMILCDLTKEMLRNCNVGTFIAHTGCEAVKIFTENQDVIELCIFDMNLDQELGVNVFDSIRKISDDFISVLASGMFTDDDVKFYKEKGFDEIIKKPYRLKDLNSLVKKHLG
ncbi:MAG: hypothetical protein CSB55_07080 [Candidatus Cloacimonadota bacterium]|nr:MAG: hypothetical protein CSB55_07080 [Candidatus Cloacimonadota bacterium]